MRIKAKQTSRLAVLVYPICQIALLERVLPKKKPKRTPCCQNTDLSLPAPADRGTKKEKLLH